MHGQISRGIIGGCTFSSSQWQEAHIGIIADNQKMTIFKKNYLTIQPN